MEERVLAVDLGASSGRVMAGSLVDGRIVYEEMHRFKNSPKRVDGTLRWDIDDLFYNIKLGIKKSAQKYKILSIGIDTWGVDFGLIDKVMEGATRPGHFNGVAQVVSRLFNIVEPDKAYFGQKDFQQIAVIRAMVAQLGVNIEIVECPIIRDIDGLALSSRNTLLTPEHRAAAPHIYEVLYAATAKVSELTPKALTEWVTAEVEKNPLLKVIYFEAVNALTMQSVESWQECERVQGCIAVQAGEIRLIDNIKLK
jgi:pantoate--beta-alanine ligase